MNPLEENSLHVSRREFFGRTATGLGTAALASLLAKDGHSMDRVGGLSELPHFAPKASESSTSFRMEGQPTSTYSTISQSSRKCMASRYLKSISATNDSAR